MRKMRAKGKATQRLNFDDITRQANEGSTLGSSEEDADPAPNRDALTEALADAFPLQSDDETMGIPRYAIGYK